MARKKIPCFDAALKILALRGHAVKDIAGKLKKKDYEGYDIAQTIEKLEEKGFLNDTKFAEERTRYRAEYSRWGVARIRQELKQMGVAEDLIEKALTKAQTAEEKYDTAHDFQQTAIDLLNRRFGVLEKTEAPVGFDEKQHWQKQQEKEKKKRLNFLLRRGFSTGEALKALEENTQTA